MSNHALHDALAANRAATLEISELRGQLERLRAELRQAHRAPNRADQLSSLLYTIEGVDEVDFSEDGDGDLVITLFGVTVNDDGFIVPKSQEFEAEFEVTVRGSIAVRAADESDAEALVEEILYDYARDLDNVSLDSSHDEVDSVYVGDFDVEHSFRYI